MSVDANRISCAASVCASSKPYGNSTHKGEWQMLLSQLDGTHMQILDASTPIQSVELKGAGKFIGRMCRILWGKGKGGSLNREHMCELC